jgi:phytanoyl-CoA hydroxylase
MDRASIERFRRVGFVVVEGLVPPATVRALASRFIPLFGGEFPTGVYPDEWYWRPGMSRDDVTRHMGNAWKSDPTVAELVLSPTIGHLAARLTGWPSVRLGQDTLWWKPASGTAVALHQDDTFMASLDPPTTITCWIALDDTTIDGGTIEYVPGSHRWPLVERRGAFHAPDDYRADMVAEATALGQVAPATRPIPVTAGTGVFHDGRTWHGSAPNARSDTARRSIGVHMLRGDVRYRADQVGYIYGRYRRAGTDELDETFFPITWADRRPPTSWRALPPLARYQARDPLAREAADPRAEASDG